MIRITVRLALPRDQAIGTSSSAIRRYATPAKAGSGGKKKETVSRGSGRGGIDAGDSRSDVIKKVLYESDPTDESRLAALAKVVPSLEAHETITRAWALHTRQKREDHKAELARKYDAMRNAIDLLEETDKSLWDKAVGGKKFQNVDQKAATNARLDGLVPRELRVPMEHPGTNMWDAEWKAPVAAAPERTR
ncbi:large subunit ribosomal protein L40, partial [Phenoliferia sp. Uapishka_3]